VCCPDDRSWHFSDMARCPLGVRFRWNIGSPTLGPPGQLLTHFESQSQCALPPAAITTLLWLLRRALCDSDASILPPSLRRYQSIGRFCTAACIRRSSVRSTAAYSFKGLSQIIKLMAELGTLRVREGKGEPTRCFDSERFGIKRRN
jgi:hypothetical protein